MRRWMLLLGTVLLLSGCYDAREIDERDFVQMLAVDVGADGQYQVTLAIGDDSGQLTSRTGEGKTLAEAMAAPEAKQSRTIYYGHTRAILLGQTVLEEEKRLRQVAETFCAEQVLSLKTYVVAAKKAGDVVNHLCEGNQGTIDQFYQNNKGDWEETFPVYLKDVETKAVQGATLLVPWAAVQEERVLLAGCAVVSGGAFLGTLDGEETAGLTWCGKTGSGRVATVLADGQAVSVRVNRRSAKVEEGDCLSITIYVTGEVLQSGPFDLTDPKAETQCLAVLEDALTKEAQKGLLALQALGVTELKERDFAVKTEAVFASAGMSNPFPGENGT